MYSTPIPGQPAKSFLTDVSLWRDVLAAVAYYKSMGSPGNPYPEYGKPSVFAENNTGADIEEGSAVYLNPFNAIPTAIIEAERFAPIADVVTPVWHSKIDNVFVANKFLPDKEGFFIGTSRYAVTKLSSYEPAHNWAMIDPADPSKFKSATAGIFKIVGSPGDDRVTLDTYQSFPFWRFELTAEATGVNMSAKLVNWDATEYAPSVTVKDYDGLFLSDLAGQKGYCVQTGNDFVAWQGPC